MNIFNNSLWFFSDHWTGETANDVNGLQHPRAWRSSNGGSTWVDELSLPQYGTAQIFCFGEKLNGKLYVQAAYLGCFPRESFTRVYDGSSWVIGPTFAPTGRVTTKTGVVANNIVMIHDNRLYAFDGTSTTMKNNTMIHDYTISGGELFVLRFSGQVCRTRNLGSFQCFDHAPSTARSIEVLDGKVYVGTSLGQIYEAPIPERKQSFLASLILFLLGD